MTTKTYTVHRAMHGNGRDYERGDTREMTEADAAEMVATGALSLEGEEPIGREPGIVHTYGEPHSTAPTYVSAVTGEVVPVVADPAEPDTRVEGRTAPSGVQVSDKRGRAAPTKGN